MPSKIVKELPIKIIDLQPINRIKFKVEEKEEEKEEFRGDIFGPRVVKQPSEYYEKMKKSNLLSPDYKASSMKKE